MTNSSVDRFSERHYRLLAAAVLGLAAFNLTFRLGSETVNEWDESLYAISAWEMMRSGKLVATTFLGSIDYYNSKPPLNVWLIALSFTAFGVNLVSLRLASVLSAWTTIAILQAWTRRVFGSTTALLAGLILTTCFGFFYVHSGRTAETDPLFTLLVLLTVVALWAERRHPAHRLWLGAILSAAFLLRGTAVFMPAAIVVAVLVADRSRRPVPWVVNAGSLLAFVVPVAFWSVARWRVDRWEFFERMIDYDFWARSTTVIEGHPGSIFYYLNILQKHQYDWLLMAAVAVAVAPIPWTRVRDRLATMARGTDSRGVLLVAWAGVTLAIPTLMRTKLPWYLNPFYPVFAVSVAALVTRALSHSATMSAGRRAVLVGTMVLALGVAEGKLIWYSYHYRDVSDTTQGLVLQERQRLRHHQIFVDDDADHDDLYRADLFVVDGVVGGRRRSVRPAEDLRRDSRPGDCVVSAKRAPGDDFALVRKNRRRSLYCRPG